MTDIIFSEVGVEIMAGVVADLVKGEGREFLLDVREHHEWQKSSIKQAHHIPMNNVPDRLAEIPKDKTIYVFCHHGGRSAMVCQFLSKLGYDCKNIKGGIHQYALTIDNSIPTYDN